MSILSSMSDTQKFGYRYELWAMGQLQQHGYDARPLSLWTDRADILIRGNSPLYVEVKAARASWQKVRPGQYRQRWQFDTSRLRGDCDHVVILIAIDHNGDAYPFVVPSWELWSRGNVSITSHPQEYRGRLKKYLKNWTTIPRVMTRRQSAFQLPLFESLGYHMRQ